MALIYQTAQFYWRGSVANETMANMTEDQKSTAWELTAKIARDPEMEKHKKKLYGDLNKTIKGDYKDWKDQACNQEYLLTIYKGVVLLLYHHKYTFKCSICNATTYKSKGKNKSLPIQSRRTQDSDECPNCGHTRQDGTSPILAIKGVKCYNDPWSILADEEQMCKFFGHLLSNACKQQLRENPIATNKRSVTMTDFADLNILREIEKILHRFKVGIKKIEINQGSAFAVNALHFEVNSLPSEFVGQILSMRRKAETNGVTFRVTNLGIELQRTPDTKTITTTIEEKSRISMCLPSQGVADAPDILEVSSEETDHCSSVIARDLIENIKELLPNEACLQLLDLEMEIGEIFQKHIKKYGDAKPTCKTKCELIGITKVEYETCKVQIKSAMIYYGMTPEKKKKRKLTKAK